MKTPTFLAGRARAARPDDAPPAAYDDPDDAPRAARFRDLPPEVRQRRAARRAAAGDAELPERPRRGAKRTVMHAIRQIPAYLRLLGGLLRDGRVSLLDKGLVGAAIAYAVLPIDFVPDFIPFLGQVDDVFLLVTALQRLIAGAGTAVLLDHWVGDPDEVDDLNLGRTLAAAAFFLPFPIQRKLKRLARRARR